jgi:glyoxylase-like metal-dependent hydrolase (beta-lactamase superfamily II)
MSRLGERPGSWDAVEGDPPLRRKLPPAEPTGPALIRPGIWALRLPIPVTALTYVIVYVFETPAGPVLVDAGWNTAEGWDALTAGLRALGFAPHQVHGILVTHFHPDHYGLAPRIRSASGAWIAIHQQDAARLPGQTARLQQDTLRWLRLCGVPANALDSVYQHTRDGTSAGPDRLLSHGELVRLGPRALRVIWTPGHSPGHTCLYEPSDRLLFTGDHVLPRITATVGRHPLNPGNPLADYLASLQHVRQLDVKLACPAHEHQFGNLSRRLDEIHQHHRDRLAKTLELVRAFPRQTTWVIAQQMQWSRPWGDIDNRMRWAAVAETLAHLEYLRTRHDVHSDGRVAARWSC